MPTQRVLLVGSKERLPDEFPYFLADQSGEEVLAEATRAVQEALTRVAEKGYDAIVCWAESQDELAAVIRLRKARPDVPIVVLTSQEDPSFDALARQAGATRTARARSPEAASEQLRRILKSGELTRDLLVQAQRARTQARDVRVLASETRGLVESLSREGRFVAPRPSEPCPARILLVDDTEANLLALESILAGLGEILVRAKSGQEALAALLQEEFALVLLDARMPDMDGFEAATLIRRQRRLKDLPIIFISAFTPEAGNLERAYELGAVDFLVKPLSAGALRAKVQVFLELHRAKADLARRVAERTAQLEKEIAERRRAERIITEELRAVSRLKATGDFCAYSGSSLQDCLQEILFAGIQLIGAQKGSLQLVDPDSGTLGIAVHHGFDEPSLRFFEALDGGALKASKRVLMENIEESPLFAGQESRQALLKAGVRAVQSTPLLGSDGKVLGILSTHFSRPHHFEERELGWLDLLARKAGNYLEIRRAQDQLRGSEERERARSAELEAIMESVPAAILITKDREGKFIVGNARSYEILRMHPGQNVSKSAPEGESSIPYEVYIDGVRARPEELPIQKAAATGKPVFGHEQEIRFSDGSSRWIYGNAVPIFDGENRVKEVVAAFVDVTARRQAEGEILRLNATLEEKVKQRTSELSRVVGELQTFSYTIAHDLRAPLRTMRGFSEILLEESGERLGPEGQHAAARIVDGAKRMDALTADLLAFGRVAQAQASPEILDLDVVVSEVLRSFEEEIRATSASVRVSRPLGLARATHTLACQALGNLVSNACKFTELGRAPVVEIGAERIDGRVRLWVEDQGIGIEERHQPKLFGMFERLEPGRYPGTGIGLAIVRKAAERMGGRAGVESEPGKGSRFWIELPSADARFEAGT
jgi:signal transduction histidine kinase/CheY-like chemotaxis protein/GAF domain-containing protein